MAKKITKGSRVEIYNRLYAVVDGKGRLQDDDYGRAEIYFTRKQAEDFAQEGSAVVRLDDVGGIVQ